MNILVIDDKRDNLISLKAIINDKFQDAKLYMASDGPEGIKIANKVDPDVILLDIVMPGMDGFEVCSVLKNDDKTKDIPVIFITALKGDKQSRIKSLEVGGEAFLSKPIDESELIAQLNAMARIKESRNDKKLEAVNLEKLVKEKTREIEKELLMRKKAQEQLSKNENKFRSLFDESSEGILLLDVNSNPIDVNNKICEILGYSKDEIMAVNASSFIHPNDLEGVDYEERLNQLKAGKSINVDYRLRKKDGKYIHVELSVKMLENGAFLNIVRDINDKKLAEELLKENEAQLKFAQQSAGAGLWDWDMKTNKIVWSPELFTLFGLDPEQHETSFETWDKCIHPDDKDSAYEKLNISIKDHTQLNNEYRVVHPNGKIIWVNAIGNTSYGEEGNPIRNAGICIDITKRKHIEENLKNTFNLSPSIITKANLNTGFYIEANQAITRILGYSIEEFTSKPYTDLVHPDDIQITTGKVTEQTEGNEVSTFENRFLCKDGSYKWLSWNATSADSEGIALGVASDITKRKESEVQLKTKNEEFKRAKEKAEENEEKYRLLHENAGLGIGYYNTDGTVISFNSVASEDMNGVPEDFVGKSIFDLFPKEYGNVYFERLQKAAKSDEIEVYEDTVKLPTGKKWFLSTYTRIVNSKSEVLGIQIISQDVTKIKQSEVELKSAKEKAEESERLKSAFLANMSHEIRTPMNGILGFISLLKDPSLTTEQTNKYSEIINSSGKRLLDTINDIIDISKIEAGEVKITEEETSLSNILDEVFSFHLPEATRKGLSLSYKTYPAGDQTIVITDNHKLVGILSNIIKNAIKYTEKGTIEFGYKLKNEVVEFFVEDTGIGIPNNRIQAIFNRFEQADIEDKKAYEGSGLGLAIAKAYVEMLGGKIDVKSEDGKGSIFKFTIPNNINVEKEIADIPLPIGNDTSRIKELNLLIAEDEDVSSELLLAYFKDIINNIRIVKNGEEAIEACKQDSEIDLILMDVKMPKMDGYIATHEIRKFNKELIIIAQTAYSLPGDREKAINAGCNDYITKPIDKNRLIEVINRHLS